ncbi:MAG TPA: hypothetical protein VMT46_12790, partial [Anaerolineaceae bacterium]|nr:hypothetical protein [Anaerolineaceae bacterium]
TFLARHGFMIPAIGDRFLVNSNLWGICARSLQTAAPGWRSWRAGRSFFWTNPLPICRLFSAKTLSTMFIWAGPGGFFSPASFLHRTADSSSYMISKV